MRIDVNNFSYIELVDKHKNDCLVFMSLPSKDKQHPYCNYKIVHNGESRQKMKHTLKAKDKTSPILSAINYIVSKLPNNTKVYFIVSKSIRLQSYLNCKKPKETKLYNHLIDTCKSNSIFIDEIVIEKGENAICDIITPKRNKKSDPYARYKPTKIKSTEFEFSKFIKSNGQHPVLFVSGSCDNDMNIGWYVCKLCHRNIGKKIIKESFASNSPNYSMLIAILDYCENEAQNNAALSVVVPAEIGFNHPKKSVNKNLLMRIFNICDQKKIDLRTFHIDGGGETLRRIIYDTM